MASLVQHSFTDFKDLMNGLSNRTAEEEFFDGMGTVALNYANRKKYEAEQWKHAYEQEHSKNEYLISLLKQNGIEVPDLMYGIPTSIPKLKLKDKCFRNLVQIDDVENFLKILHDKIDGNGGKDVAAILLRAIEDKAISRRPTEKEFMQEFPKIKGSFHSISHYLNPNHPIDYSSVKL